MIQIKHQRPLLALLAACLGLTAAGPPARAAEEEAPAHYAAFLSGSASPALLRAALKAYLGALSGVDDFPPIPSPDTGRPAGPRDEPPPPEWPLRPVGLALCLKIDGRIRACEGGPEPAAEQLLEAVTLLGERLAAVRGRRRPEAGEILSGTLEATFILDPRTMSLSDAKREAGTVGLDLGARGLIIEGAGGIALVMPGEAGSLKKAIRMARQAGAVKSFRKPSKIVSFAPARAGSAPFLNP